MPLPLYFQIFVFLLYAWCIFMLDDYSSGRPIKCLLHFGPFGNDDFCKIIRSLTIWCPFVQFLLSFFSASYLMRVYCLVPYRFLSRQLISLFGIWSICFVLFCFLPPFLAWDHYICWSVTCIVLKVLVYYRQMLLQWTNFSCVQACWLYAISYRLKSGLHFILLVLYEVIFSYSAQFP